MSVDSERGEHRGARLRPLKIASVTLAALSAAPPAAAETRVLAAGDLRVEIEIATDRLAAEFGPRFDRTAVVSSVVLDGLEFLGPWGLPDEFGLFGDGVLGFAGAAAGDSFLKIGVGRLLRDTDAEYQFSHPYPVAALFPVDVESSEHSISVSQRSEGGGPWHYRYRKTYTLSGPGELTIAYELTNTGSAEWTFEHYNHHWFRIGDAAVGPGYELVTGFELPPGETTLRRGGSSLQIPAPMAPDGAAYYAGELAGVPPDANTFEVRVDRRASVGYRASFAPARFALYADVRGFCPEVFMRAALAPGESFSWSASYRFVKPRP